MKALTYERYGGPEVVQVADIDPPSVGSSDIFVRVHASAVNTGDWRIRAAAFPSILAIPGRLIFGLFRPRQQRLGSESAGIVESVGTSAKRFSPGDRVFGMVPSGGASAEYLAIS